MRAGTAEAWIRFNLNLKLDSLLYLPSSYGGIISSKSSGFHILSELVINIHMSDILSQQSSGTEQQLPEPPMS